MIILPDRHAPRGKFLLPMRKKDWMPASRAIPKDQLGNDTVETVYRIRARLNDGHVAWIGLFKDREDFDVFLFAAASGSLAYEPALWQLPTPSWYPGIAEDFAYDFATLTFLTTTGSTQTYTSPVDWNNANNSIEGIGGGGSGGAYFSGGSGQRAGGGGGGEYRKINNYTFASPGTTTVNYIIGAGGAGVTGSSIGRDGSATSWNTTSLIANGGLKGSVSGSTTAAGGAGGSGGTGAGGNANGGAGGTASASRTAGGGGGAGGPNGAGVAGGSASSINSAGDGGAGDNGVGGAGSAASTSNSAAGGDGTEWQVSPAYGSGGGSGGAQASSATTTGNGGTYGAGSGGAVASSSLATGTKSGNGRQGLIVVTYSTSTARGLVFNIPLLGL